MNDALHQNQIQDGVIDAPLDGFREFGHFLSFFHPTNISLDRRNVLIQIYQTHSLHVQTQLMSSVPQIRQPIRRVIAIFSTLALAQDRKTLGRGLDTGNYIIERRIIHRKAPS
jgi:hypothetical protein